MFFIISKILWAMVSPLTFVTLLIGGGYLARAKRWGRGFIGLGAAILVIFGIFPMGQNILVFLENKVVSEPLPTKEPDGILVLGGFLDLKNSVARQQVEINSNGSRLTEMLALANRYPKARLVFSGGDGNLIKTSSSESEQLAILLKQMGFETLRIEYEGRSKNTYENMVYSREMIQPRESETWILITSAFHMPRSLAIFRSCGWQVTPYPVGYMTDGKYEWLPDFDVLGNMSKFHVAVREFIGIMAYTLTDKIKPNEIKRIFFHADDSRPEPDLPASKS